MPQNQKTEPIELAELPLLNAQEEALVEAWAQGHDQVTCYRMAYGAEGYSLPALKVKACRKFGENRIQAHLRALQAHGMARIRLTVEDRLAQELAFAQRAEDAGNFGAAGQANDRVNKLLGLYIDKVQDVTDRTDPVQTLRELEKVAGAEVAASLAAEHGIEWKPAEGTTRH